MSQLPTTTETGSTSPSVALPQAAATPAESAAQQPSSPTPADSAAEPAAFQPRVYAPGDVACRHQNDDLTNCGAEPGEPCVWQQAGQEGTCHAERIEDAAAISNNGGTLPTEQQFDEAVLDSGLF